jgi:hypothetical protein
MQATALPLDLPGCSATLRTTAPRPHSVEIFPQRSAKSGIRDTPPGRSLRDIGATKVRPICLALLAAASEASGCK